LVEIITKDIALELNKLVQKIGIGAQALTKSSHDPAENIVRAANPSKGERKKERKKGRHKEDRVRHTRASSMPRLRSDAFNNDNATWRQMMLVWKETSSAQKNGGVLTLM